VKILILLILLLYPLAASAEQEGFFDPEITEKGYFDDDRASIPIKNPTGNTTSRKPDSFDLNGNSGGIRDSVMDDSPRNYTGTPSSPGRPPAPPLPRGGAQDMPMNQDLRRGQDLGRRTAQDTFILNSVLK
jgi:hypothetical protein